MAYSGLSRVIGTIRRIELQTRHCARVGSSLIIFSSTDAGWSSLAARRAHNPKVVGSNPTPATKYSKASSRFSVSVAIVSILPLGHSQDNRRRFYADLRKLKTRRVRVFCFSLSQGIPPAQAPRPRSIVRRLISAECGHARTATDRAEIYTSRKYCMDIQLYLAMRCSVLLHRAEEDFVCADDTIARTALIPVVQCESSRRKRGREEEGNSSKTPQRTDATKARRGRPAGRSALTAGSLAAQLWGLKPGECLLRPDVPGERRACTRAISQIAERDNARVYEVALWLALHHTGHSGTMRVLRIERKV